MFRFLTLCSGFLTSFIILINGRLANPYGIYGSTFVIHIVGTLTAFLIMLKKLPKISELKKVPFYLYLGGMVGFSIAIFNNISFAKLSVTSIVALGLLGQTLCSLFIDYFGILGAEKINFSKSNIISLPFAMAGIFLMIYYGGASNVYAIIASLMGGCAIVISRTFNSALALRIGLSESSFFAHLIGLICIIILTFFVAPNELTYIPTVPWWFYLGGSLGVITIMMSNYAVPNLSSFEFTILCFIGQIFMSTLIDFLIGNSANTISFLGGLIVAFGILIQIIAEKTVKIKTV